ncbi:hypothetical protein [Caenispirillum bisanense]|uniref:DUF3618 domain-containing protein n=1 Tax=Caenispirillum bisanense TaxID=414052 RepID=A0A286GIP4_9PROT|nr:hypothetical protein [Caenispirillum bisanense]SOD94844.1 hypothetical protein SAMN05421508_104140 [Caenispirillum bisanense]
MADPHRGNGTSDADRLRDLVREARDTGVQAAERTFDGARDSAADRAHRTGEALRDAAGRLEGDPIGRAMTLAADRLDDLSDALRRQDMRGVMDQVTGFAQRQPVLFVGGMLALGLAIGRFAAAGTGADYAGRARDEVRHRGGTGSSGDDVPVHPTHPAAGSGAAVGVGAPSEATRPRPTATSASPGGGGMPGRGSAAPTPTEPDRQTPSTTHDPSGRPH